MLIVSETRYVPTAVNMTVLQGEDGMFYYMHRSLYDQCVVLRDQYINLLPSFYKLFGFETEHPSVCDQFMSSVPEPLDILGPFLSLVGNCEELDGIEEMCGALSVMSMTVDFRKMFKVPAAVRQSIKFSLSVREEYRVQWDRFFLETPTLEQVSFSVTSTEPRAAAYAESKEEVEEEEDLGEVTFVGDGAYSMDDLMAQLEASSVSDVAESSDGTYEDENKPKTKSGFAMLRGL